MGNFKFNCSTEIPKDGEGRRNWGNPKVPIIDVASPKTENQVEAEPVKVVEEDTRLTLEQYQAKVKRQDKI